MGCTSGRSVVVSSSPLASPNLSDSTDQGDSYCCLTGDDNNYTHASKDHFQAPTKGFPQEAETDLDPGGSSPDLYLMDKTFRFGRLKKQQPAPTSSGRVTGQMGASDSHGPAKTNVGRAGRGTSAGAQRGMLDSTGTWSPSCTPLSALSLGEDTPDGRAAFAYPSGSRTPLRRPDDSWYGFRSPDEPRVLVSQQSDAFLSPITPLGDEDEVFLDGKRSRELSADYERVVPRERNARSLATSPRIKLLQYRCGFLPLESDELSSLVQLHESLVTANKIASFQYVQSSA